MMPFHREICHVLHHKMPRFTVSNVLLDFSIFYFIHIQQQNPFDISTYIFTEMVTKCFTVMNIHKAPCACQKSIKLTVKYEH